MTIYFNVATNHYPSKGMENESKEIHKYLAIALTGIVSLAVGVASALIINQITRDRLSLTYEITSANFGDNTGQKVGIFAVRISNKGTKEIEALQGTIELNNANLTRHQQVGVPEASIHTVATNTGVDFTLPFLNSKESFTMQLLIEPTDQLFRTPKITLRAKGVTGVDEGPERSGKSGSSRLTTILVPLSTILSALGMSFILKRKRGGIFQGGAQRDEFAYILGANGFIADANILRESTRDHSYWAVSDWFTENLLHKEPGDVDALRRGIHVLEMVIDYAERMAPSSIAVILFNGARLARKANDPELAKQFISKARKVDAAEVDHRLKIDGFTIQEAEKAPKH